MPLPAILARAASALSKVKTVLTTGKKVARVVANPETAVRKTVVQKVANPEAAVKAAASKGRKRAASGIWGGLRAFGARVMQRVNGRPRTPAVVEEPVTDAFQVAEELGATVEGKDGARLSAELVDRLRAAEAAANEARAKRYGLNRETLRQKAISQDRTVLEMLADRYGVDEAGNLVRKDGGDVSGWWAESDVSQIGSDEDLLERIARAERAASAEYMDYREETAMRNMMWRAQRFDNPELRRELEDMDVETFRVLYAQSDFLEALFRSPYYETTPTNDPRDRTAESVQMSQAWDSYENDLLEMVKEAKARAHA